MDKIKSIVKLALGRESYHPLITYPIFLIKVLVCKWRYRRELLRLRRKALARQRIRVMFLCMDTAKWKCQSLYDLLKDSDLFEPVIALTMTYEDENHTPQQIQARNDNAESFFENLGCRVVRACVPDENSVLPLSSFGADIVFYQVPWGNLDVQTVWKVSRGALCCYVPYSIETVAQKAKSERFNFDHQACFHSLLFAVFQWSESYAHYYKSVMMNWEWAGNVYGFGYPALDPYCESRDSGSQDGYVIFAPHFSFEYNGQMPILNIGTFQWSGREMLSYAKTHPEIKWLFKPHPKLRERLVEIGFMTAEEVERYYSEWERIGEACYDGDYAKYFIRSKAMITDSSSFLMEYMAVGKPLIHLVPLNDNTQVCPQAKSVFETFYIAQNERDLRGLLHLIVEDGQDPRKEERLSAAKEAMVFGNCAARRILNWMEDVVQGKSCGGLR